MSDHEGERVTLEANPDFYPLPPADGKEHTAFPLKTRMLIVGSFLDGRSVDDLAKVCQCNRMDIEQVLRVQMESTK